MNRPRYSRRDFLRTASKGVSCLGLFASLYHCAQPARRPNIILIMADDLGYGDLSCYGNKIIHTPHIDKLAEGGLRFEDFHSNGAVCTPTRAALLTGRYQQRCGLEEVILVQGETRQTGLAQEEVTFAEILKKVGYKVGMVGKWHLGFKKEFNPINQGFDLFHGYVSGNIDYQSHYDNSGSYDWWHNLIQIEEKGYVTDLITYHAINFIRDNKSRPFCLYVCHECPHWPYQGRLDKADRFPGIKFPSHGSRIDKKAAYKEMIEVMDEGIGRIMETLIALDLNEDTFIFFCSDNGAISNIGSNDPLRGGKNSLWEGGHRVPGIAHWPRKIKPGSVTHETVMSMDLFPTIAALAGAILPEELHLDGVDFSPLLLKREPLPPRALFWKYQKQKAIRKGDWKLLATDKKLYLFDLAADVSERNNIADEHTDVIHLLLQEFEAWENDTTACRRMLTT